MFIPALEGRDLIARAKTGTGKTLAFGIPILKHLTGGDEHRSLRYLRDDFTFFNNLPCLSIFLMTHYTGNVS